jgi:hypothetical protein
MLGLIELSEKSKILPDNALGQGPVAVATHPVSFQFSGNSKVL